MSVDDRVSLNWLPLWSLSNIWNLLHGVDEVEIFEELRNVTYIVI